MAYKVRCSACGKSMWLPESDAGLGVVCLACGTKFAAPSTDRGEAFAESAPQAQTQTPAIPSTPPPLPRADAPSLPAAQPFRVSWGVAAAVCAVLVLISFGTWRIYRWYERKAGAQELTAMYLEAQDLAADGNLRAAHQKYRELDRRATEIGTDDPDVKALADQARGEQEQVFAMMLLQSAAPGSQYGVAAPLPATAPSVVETPASKPTTAPVTPAPSETAVDRFPPPPRPDDDGRLASASPVAPPAPPLRSPTEVATTTKPAAPTVVAQRTVKRQRPRPVPAPLTGVTDEEIGRSIQRGVDFLIPLFDKRTGQLGPFRGRAGDEGYVCGLNALCVYALLQSGQAIADQRLDIHGPFMKSLIEGMKRFPANSGKATYARGIRATALALYNRKEDRAALRADVTYLLMTHDEGRYTYAGSRNNSSSRRGSGGPWDNSNSQYGLLGVWSGAEVGVEVPGDYWAHVHKHWVTCQNPDGTWGYTRGGGAGTVSMAAAGTASLFVAEDYLYNARFGARVGREPFSEPLKRALDWWERGEDVTRGITGWWGYTMYGIERVGLASGFKYFGAQDWYRALAGRVVDRQQPDGSWGDPIDTAYALLFLARGRHPILMNKLRFDKGGSTGEIPGYWGNRPRDAANLARFAGRQLERPLNWQVVTLARDWHDWLDSPILSIGSHRAPFFTDADCEKFKNYVEAGGMLYLNADGESPEFAAFARRFVRRLFPQYEMKDLPPAHVLYNTVYKVEPPSLPLKAVSNGTRVLILFSQRDMAKAWQIRDERTKEGDFQLGINMFVYAAGKRELRNRLSSPYVSPPDKPAPLGSIDVARVKYAGAWDPEPGAWRRFANWFHRQTGTALAVDTVSLGRLGSSDSTPRFAHLTGNVAYKLTGEEVQSLKSYVTGGGVLFVDACGGDAAFGESFKAALAEAFPEQTLRTLPRHHSLLKADAPGMEDLRRPRLRPYVIERDENVSNPGLRILRAGKGVVLFSDLDVTSGLLGTETWGIYGYDPSYAQSLMKNLIFWTADGKPE
jgi:hypothetical protein